MILNVGQRVKVDNTKYAPETPIRSGVIIGHSVVNLDTKYVHLLYMVKLDDGFWSEDKSLYIGILPCDPSIIKPEESN